MYLIPADLKRTIQDVNLNQIISNDQTILDKAILAAEAEAKSYLRQKYDLTQEFTDTITFSPSVTYSAANRVVYNNDLWFVKFPHPPFEYSGLYNVGDEVFWKNKVYTCLIQTTLLSHDVGLQYGKIQNLPSPNVAPDDPKNGIQYWGTGTTYSVAPAASPGNAWEKGDNRDAQMVMFIIDVALFHLHSRIAPRNIPELRVQRYDAAINWFRMCATGEVTPALPILQPKQGGRIRFGGSIKQINSY